MRFTSTEIPGAYLIEPQPSRDERGWFARLWCAEQFAAHGLNSQLVQCSLSHSRRCYTLRGLHYQAEPHAEAKLIRCTQGRIYDVIVDLRRDSPAYLRWAAFELSSRDYRMLYIPEGCAHGFLTLADNTEVQYQMSQVHTPEAARGVRWNDPLLGICWPESPACMSPRDRDYPDYVPAGPAAASPHQVSRTTRVS